MINAPPREVLQERDPIQDLWVSSCLTFRSELSGNEWSKETQLTNHKTRDGEALSRVLLGSFNLLLSTLPNKVSHALSAVCLLGQYISKCWGPPSCNRSVLKKPQGRHLFMSPLAQTHQWLPISLRKTRALSVGPWALHEPRPPCWLSSLLTPRSGSLVFPGWLLCKRLSAQISLP